MELIFLALGAKRQSMHFKVLSKSQIKIIENLSFLKNQGFYLAGGTALALQIGHRTSIDLDFYNLRTFNPEKILPLFNKNFNNFSVRQATTDTLILTINKTDLSFFYYPYQLIAPLKTFETINLTSIKDIAAMKIAAIVQRGKRRDFIDIYYLLKKYSLKEIIKFALKKYPGYQQMLILKALIYFEDMKEEELERRIKVFDKNFSWVKAKGEILKKTREYQLSLIKK